MTGILYHDLNPYCCQWLRNLIGAGILPKGEIICGDIADLRGDDLKGFHQVHTFCGLGGWPYALKCAGWGDRPVWTGSCPCQPWSVSGKRKGAGDARHLWPDWRRLITERSPDVVFGEQVTGTPEWLNLVRSDLENLGYAVGAMPMEAASAGADHFRDRYWFVADRDNAKRRSNGTAGNNINRETTKRNESASDIAEYTHSLLADIDGQRPQEPVGECQDVGTQRAAVARDRVRDVEHAACVGWGEGWSESKFRSRGFTAAVTNIDGSQFVQCPDRKWRRLPPSGVRWLGVGVPARIPTLQALGNSIDTRPAIAFVKAYMELNRV